MERSGNHVIVDMVPVLEHREHKEGEFLKYRTLGRSEQG